MCNIYSTANPKRLSAIEINFLNIMLLIQTYQNIFNYSLFEIMVAIIPVSRFYYLTH